MPTNQKAKVTVEPAEAVSKDTQAASKPAKTAAKSTEARARNYDNAVKASTETFTQSYEEALSATKEQLEKLAPAAAKGFDEWNALGKSNFEAFVNASTIAAKGFETIGKEVIAYNQGTVEANLLVAKKLFDVQNFQEAMELQTGFAREAFDKMVSETSKISELSIKVANETAAPLNARFSETVKTFSKPVTA